MENTKKKFNWKIMLVVEILVLLGLIIGYVVWLANHKMDKIEYNEIPEEDLEFNENLNLEVMSGYTNILLFGVDSRDGNLGKGARSDCNIIVNINNDTKEVRMVSVYRDTFLEIATEHPSNRKYNEAYFYGGPTTAINTINRNMDMNIKDYVTVNWEAVIKAVDIVGGIEVTLKKGELKSLNRSLKEQNEIYGTNVPGITEPGTYTLNGAQALAFARIRSTAQGDITRTERQRKVIGLVVDKVKRGGLDTLNKMMDEIFPMISTSISKNELVAMATGMLSYEITDSVGFPWTFDDPKLDKKGWVLSPADLEHNVMALHKYLYGEENYQVSETVKRITDSIKSETGTGYIKIDYLEGEPGDGTEEGATEDSSQAQ